ncbi:MAG: cellulase family glycosylhydrolase [Balneolaceae bacterium]|nr:cellulase family glycosylhydrolase [Balneolaceae bacterium]
MKKALYFLGLLLIFTQCKSSTNGPGEIDDTDLNGYNETTFFKTDGTEILNRQGDPVVIRGFGLGGWLMPEGYMFNMPGDFGPTKLQNAIEDLIGASETERWFEEFRTNYVQEADIIAMKEWGADHIRIPFNHKVFYDIDTQEFNEREFDRLDQVLIWCKRHRMDVILGMHGAPGGQSNKEIADSDGEARLWTEYETYMPITIKIWKEIARRYKDETIIIGYDLLNEPVTPDGYGAADVLRFHTDIIPEIREVDQNHILFINGNYFSTTFDMLDQIPSQVDNVAYSFHKYWNETDQGTINYLLDLRNRTQTPLWLGESGENSNPWFYEATKLVEDNNIGWNWWTHKKLGTITSPLSAKGNANYYKVVDFWKGNGPRPSADDAKDGLFQMAADLAIEKTELRPDVVAALFSPDFGSRNQPYTELTIPGTIAAVHYDIGNNGVSYYDTEYKRVSSDDNQNNGNNGWSMRNDGVDIEESAANPSGYNIGWIETGEWLEYTAEVTASGEYTVKARVSSGNSDGRFRVRVNDKPVGPDARIPNTGGFQNWQEITLGTDDFEAGTVLIRVEILSGGFNFSQLTFE